ncbi:DUF5749 family beta-barrel protein [Archaeoglobus veneficus]|uniref:Uncharacterized protein n=1 Tax=Archaeoglobus veneficus (strain DSM 11195 / SNP6) TaxID=693661 RepID=F2KQR7_ARCVS|nr:DUF5749 family beta-barrel protein [Archaeoglobus veneficus]AEA46629.1 hypothetical protein Arcve_0608 [Archaeoglobus veneficus SNP6]
MQDLICKYVYKDGKEFGESIDVYKDRLIIKVGTDFFAVSLDRVEKVEGDKVYIKDFDSKEAIEEGKKWIEEKSKPVSLEELKAYGFGEES